MTGAGARRALVGTLRLGLPLGALVLLSTIFLAARSVDPDRAAALAQIDTDALGRAPRIARARFAGVTEDATAVTVSAQSVRAGGTGLRGGPLQLELTAPDGTLTFPDDSRARFAARTGRLDQRAGRLRLRGNVRLRDTTGYRLHMPELTARLGRTEVTAQGGITGQAPAGRIRADRLELTRSSAAKGGYRLAFRGDVRLVYDP